MDKALKTAIDYLKRNFQPWTFEGDEPCTVELTQLLRDAARENRPENADRPSVSIDASSTAQHVEQARRRLIAAIEAFDCAPTGDSRNLTSEVMHQSLAALISAVQAQAREGWQPIETAPRDGTQILIWIAAIEPRPRIAYWADRGIEYGWFGLQSQHFIGLNVTHWMPLPAAPAEARLALMETPQE